MIRAKLFRCVIFSITCLVALSIQASPHANSVTVDINDYPYLDEKQLGGLRHIISLADQLHGEWSKMGTKEPDQEGDDAYRYQLAFMTYTLGLAQYHYLPAYRELFQHSSTRLIDKMLRREVWGYWENTSRGSKYLNPDLVELREGWVDPVKRENIMYSGHLLAMVGMYSSLYRDNRYDKPGALTFNFDPVFRGFGHEKFDYDFTKLTDVIYQQMEENDWLGVPCEPNAIFVICNQMPLLGFKFYDQVHNTNYATATGKYMSSWQKKGWLTKEQSFISYYLVQQDKVQAEPSSAYIDAWTGTYMHAWNREFVRSIYPTQRDRWIKKLNDGTLSVSVGEEAELVATADFGALATYAAEVGDSDSVNRLLAYADKYMNPKWYDGKYYYPRQDSMYDNDENLIFMPRVTGNALLTFARLNVENGLWSLYNKPLAEQYLSQPYIDGVNYPEIIVRRAYYDKAKNVLALTLVSSASVVKEYKSTSFNIRNLNDEQPYELVIDGRSYGVLGRGRPNSEKRIVESAWDEGVLNMTLDVSVERNILIIPK